MKALSVRRFRATMSAVSPTCCLATLVLSLLALTGIARADDPPADWLASVERGIAASEYFVSWQDSTALADLPAAWHAPNRAHDFRIYFTERGVRVVPRSASAPSWEWGLELTAVGREGRLAAVPAARLAPHEGRIAYDRGAIQEWYENSPRGLEQGFTIPTPPEGVEGSGGAPLVLQLALTGTLSPRLSENGQAIDFVAGDWAPVVHFSQLKVADARDRELPARFAGWSGDGARGIQILIDDRDASYPLYVDPLATSPAWIGEANQVQANFGYAVATAGDVNGDGYSDVIVGAPYYDNGETNEGRAFVFHGSAAGLAATAAWSTESNQVDANFGFAVATAGDMDGDGYSDVIVGAPNYDNGQPDEGRAYVYCGSSAGLSSTARWTGESNQASSSFGRTVGSAGDIQGDGYSDIIVGAHYYDNTLTNEGAAFAYHSDGRYYPASPSWSAYGNQASALFGFSVGTAGDVNGDGYSDVVVGAPLYDGGEADEGGVFLFRSDGGKLEPKASWSAHSNQVDAHLGESVGTAGDVNGDGYSDIITGAMYYDNGQSNEGRVFVYHGAAGSPTAAWSYENDQANSELGRSVGTAGDVNGDGYADVIFSAIYFDNGETDEGRAYVVLGSAMGLAGWASWMMESNQASALFGRTVATAGDVNGDGFSDVIVGAQYYDDGQFDEGAAFVYHGGSSGLSGFYATEIFGPPGELGYTVASAGDVNGDGYADLVAGGPGGNGAKAYYGSSSGADDVADWSVTGVGGESVASAGDVNGDGFSDVLVGDRDYDNGQVDEGRVLLYYGSATGLAGSPGWTQESNQAVARYGWSVAGAGDINGDGYADIVVGAPYYDYWDVDQGCVWVYHGSASGPVVDGRWHCSDYHDDLYGTSVASAGDVDRDGYSDILVGVPGNAYGGVRLHFGSASGVRSGMGSESRSGLDCANELSRFGESVASAGDVNGDGYSDIVVGAPMCEGPGTEEGRVFVYHGDSSGVSENPSWSYTYHLTQYHQLGQSVACAGDVDGDGYADIVAGAPANGWAYLFNGSAAGLSASPTRSYEGRQDGDMFGYSVASAGDLNGDGYADVVVGAYAYDTASVNAGRLAIYYGNGGAGGGAMSLRPRQRRADDLGEIALRGTSEHRYNFRLLLTGRTPFGRGRVKLEWEDKPLGTLFNGASTHVEASWMNTGVSGVALDELVAGHYQSESYHWRVRLRYHPATTPFQPRSRWLTIPWNGWQEARLRTFTVDADDDGHRDFEDCNESAPSAWASPAETRNLRFAANRTTLNWDAPVDPGGSFTFYDTLRTTTASDFVLGTTCVESDDANTTSSDTATPNPGQIYFYLTRADNYCPGEGTLGNESDGTPRSGRTCP